jgi:alkylation response protein AidB-like acyl-CoA dehydrogenase
MDYRDNTDEAQFRAELKSWLAEHAPADQPPRNADERMEYNHQWHLALAQGGWLGLSFPSEYGGQGRSLIYDAILNDELGAAGLPSVPAINHITNAIRLFGTEEQKRAQLPGLLSSAVLWCQGFSEPNAGSDLSSLRTRGARVVEAGSPAVYRVDGQKIWTSEAVWARWCLLLLRTEFDVPAHRGLSMLMVPMDTPGIECRPIVTSYGSSEFAEVFFTDAEVPAANMLGQPGQGWAIAMQLLGFERGPADMGWTARLERTLTMLESRVRSGELAVSPSQREALAGAWVELQTLKLICHRVQRCDLHDYGFQR